ncbi:MAG: ribosomal protein S18-alanine N-acetyltransferase [Elusimicrobia bacterium]|nr:ribosomal protein S18-alanine N-acetyltransferase [Elusimicrobiota bacterium]
MSDLFVSTTSGEFILAVRTPTGVAEKRVETEDRIEGFFESFSQVAKEVPVSRFRRIFLDVGPGSFMGVKMGVVFARMLSQNLRIPIFPLKATDIMSKPSAGTTRRWVSPVFDSGNGFVYATLFEEGKKQEDDYMILLDEWLDFVDQLKEDILLRIRLAAAGEKKIKDRNFDYEKVGRGEFLKDMVSFAERKYIVSKIYQEVEPYYLNKIESAEKWEKKLGEEMEKIKHLREERDKILLDIDRLERIKVEKEDEISSLNELLEKKQSLQREIDKNMEEISILNAKRSAYEESLKEKETKIGELSRKAEKLEGKISELEEKIKKKQEYLEKLKNLPPEIPQEVELYLEQRDSLKKEVEELRAEKEKYTKELDEISSSRFEAVFERIRNEEKILEDVSKMREEKEEEIRQLSEELKKINAEKKEKEKAMSALTAQMEEISRKPSARTEEVTEEKSGSEFSPVSQPQASGPVAEEVREEVSAPKENEEDMRGEYHSDEGKSPEKFEVGEDVVLSSGKLPEVKLDNFRYSIRPFRISDLPKVMEIEESSFERPWRRQMFKEELSIPVSKLYTINGTFQRRGPAELMGYAVFWVVNEKAHIINFAVDPKQRRKGIAKVLLTEILKKSKSLGCKSAYLEVRVSATGCQRLFEWAGFVKKGVRKDYFGYPKEDAIIYERGL